MKVKSEKLVVGTPENPVGVKYCAISNPRQSQLSGKTEFQVTGLLKKDHPDVAKLFKAVENQLDAVYVSQGKKIPPAAWNPVRDGAEPKNDGTPQDPALEPYVFFNAKLDADRGQPVVVGPDLKPLPEGTEIQPGDYVALSLSAYGFNKGQGGVAFGLEAVQLIRKGDGKVPVGNRTDPTAAFTAASSTFLAAA